MQDLSRKILIPALVLSVVALIFSSYSLINKKSENNSGTALRDTMDKMHNTGKVDVCYVVWPPAVVKDAKTGKISGHLVETLDLIWKQIGVEPVYHEQSWGTTILGINSGNCDIMASGFFINLDRSYNIAFTKPLFYASDVALIKSDDSRFKTVYDADKEGIRVVVANGESGHDFVKNNFQNADVRVIDIEGGDMSKLGLEVSSGRADIVIVGANNLDEYAATHPEVKLVFQDNPFHVNPTSWAVRQDDQKFLNFLNASIESLEANGVMNQLEKKYNATWVHEIKSYSPIR